jgi:putative PIN family toxin of toxin-antitoxin system
MTTPNPRLVIDTNVLITALKSKRGASYKLLFNVNRNKYIWNISPTLIFEYESVAKRKDQNIVLAHSEIDAIIDMICKWAEHWEVFYLWRPFLKDPKDDFILELAIESHSDYIITYNKADFEGVKKFGIQVLTPKEILEILGEI